MNHLLAVYGDSTRRGSLHEAAARAETAALQAFDREAREAGALVIRAPLHIDVWTMSARDGAVTEAAPSSPTHRLGCFYVLECGDVAEAKGWAAKFPLVGPGGFDSIEIRLIRG